MKPERWQQVEDLFHATRERAPSDRGAFLAEQCVDDSSLRAEVQSLLDQDDGSLLSKNVGAVAALVMHPPPGAHEGRSIGPYTLGPLLGAGTMGEVYRARDTKLGRDVAVKILPPAVAQHPDRLARFEREARILAALNHPNVGAIYGLEESDDVRALVLELVEGDTLADKLSATAASLPSQESLAIARQIADALDAAHNKGIVHRDLKPANIKITPSGIVKVLDFGLAKMTATEDGPAAAPVLATSEGILLGTVAYMSPEQARGLPVDKRTDIWAFGCVMYEMTAGRRPFPGQSAADVLGAITTGEPDWTVLRADTSPRVRALLRRCLAKDPDRRLHDIADARLEIEDAIAGADDGLLPATAAPASSSRRLVPWLIATIALAVAAAMSYRAIATPPDARVPARVSIALPPDVSVFAIGRGPSVAVSPDGRRIVFAGIKDGRRQLFARLLDESESTPISGTEDGANPFFSPDGQWIGFTTAPESGKLQRVPVGGGAAVTILDGSGDGRQGVAVQGATWSPHDSIVFGAVSPRSRGLWRVAAGGGTPERLTTATDSFHTWPQILGDRRSILFTIWKGTGFAGAQIAIAPLSGGEPTVLLEGASFGRVVSDGNRRAWLLYTRADGIQAAPFDLDRLQLAGSGTPVLNGVLTNLSGAAHFAFSASGLLAYVPGGLDEINKTPLWVDRNGTTTEIPAISGLGFIYRLSPDGRRLARPSAGLGPRDLWVDDLVRRTTSLRLTDGAVINSAIWTPDGQSVIYSAGGLLRRAVDRSGSEERLTTSANAQTPTSVSPDGQTLAYYEAHPERATDIWLLPLREPRQPRLFLATPFAELNPMFSPDGRFIAYSSNLSGTFEIWVKPVGGGGEFVASHGGGFAPLWSPDGRELYYRSVAPSQGGDMMAVSIDTRGKQPDIGVPRVAFAAPYQGDGDIAPDGRFLLLKRTPLESPSRVIQLVLNWFDDLQAKAPRP